MKKDSVGASLVFKFIESIGVKGVGFVISVLMARLLEPKVFGLVAIITAITAISQTIVDSGLSTALIQNKNIYKKDYSTVFYMSLIIALILYVLLFFCAPLISLYYEIESLTLPFRILSLTLIVYSLSSVLSAKLTREMQFKKMLVCNVIVTIIAGATGVAMALYGFGLWALVYYYLLNSILTCVAYFFVANWHPQWAFSVVRAKEFFDYGYKMLFSGLLSAIFANIRTLIIGKIYSPTDLGYYNRGDQIPSVVSGTLDNVFKSVMLPYYSRLQEDKEQIKSKLRLTVSLNSFINFPAMIGLAIIAAPLVVVLYTEKWIFCVPYLQILSLANITVSIQSPCLVAIKAIGRSDIYLKLEVIRRIVMIGILLFSLCFHSLLAIAIGWLVTTFIDLIITMIPIKRLFNYTWIEQFTDILPYLLISIVMGGIIYCIGFLNLSVIVMLISQIIIGMLAYFTIALLFKAESMMFLIGRVKSIIYERRSNTI